MVSAEVDQTKIAALPVLVIIALIIAGWITRGTLKAAYAVTGCCAGEFRLSLLFWLSITSTLVSVFLLPTAAWSYGITSALFSYMFALSVGNIEKHANRLFVTTAIWFAILLGIPSGWSSGLITKVSSGCKLWFTSTEKQGDYCKDQWISFTIVVSIVIIIAYFFILLTLLSFAFDLATQDRAAAAGKLGAMQQPLKAGEDGIPGAVASSVPVLKN
jgi:hypothetical protein